MAKVLVCEDEKIILDLLCNLVEENPMVQEIFRAVNGEEAVNIIKQKSPDILILDIDLPGKNGIDVAKEAYNLNPHVYIAFVTGYAHFAAESFIVHPYDYILKPIDYDHFKETVASMVTKVECDRLKNKLQKTKRFPLKMDDRIVFLNLDDIIFIEKDGRDAVIHTKRNQYRCNYNLKNLESSLGENFDRTHKSFIVNINMIESIQPQGDTYIVKFYDYEKTALISKNKYQFIKDKLT